jgi:hypothetical protein
MFLKVSLLFIGLTPWPLVDGQPGHGVHQVDRQGTTQECSIVGNDNVVCSSDVLYPNYVEIDDGDDEEDPMLEMMPGFNFKAYKRADISSFYQEPPGSRVEMTPDFTGQAGKFQSMADERLDLYW